MTDKKTGRPKTYNTPAAAAAARFATQKRFREVEKRAKIETLKAEPRNLEPFLISKTEKTAVEKLLQTMRKKIGETYD